MTTEDTATPAEEKKITKAPPKYRVLTLDASTGNPTGMSAEFSDRVAANNSFDDPPTPGHYMVVRVLDDVTIDEVTEPRFVINRN
jgi:hypothetical protein